MIVLFHITLINPYIYYMKSITEIANCYNILSKELNDMFIRNNIYVSTTFGINDGFVDIELSDYITDRYNTYISDMLSEDAILDIKNVTVPIKKSSYIYFLINDEVIVYVGQSFQLLGRIQNHIDNNGKTFNAISIIEVDRKLLNIYERLYISIIKPQLNKTNYTNLDIIDYIVKSY